MPDSPFGSGGFFQQPTSLGKKSPYKCSPENYVIDRNSKAFYGLVPYSRQKFLMMAKKAPQPPAIPFQKNLRSSKNVYMSND